MNIELIKHINFRKPVMQCLLTCILLLSASNLLAANDTTWVQTSLDDVPVNGLLITTESHILAATYGDGVYRSTDNGESWEAINNGLINHSVLCLSKGAQNPDHIFAGTEGDGIFRSTDGGDSWEAMNNGLTTPVIFSLAAAENGFIYAGTSMGGIFRSGDNGDNWASANNGLTATEVVFDLLVHTNNDIYAATNAHGIFRSTDDGATWELSGLQNVDVRTMVSRSPENIFAGAWFDGIFHLDQNNRNWDSIGLFDRHIMELAVNSAGDIFAATHGWGVSRSTDKGATWSNFSEGLSDAGAWCLAVHENGYIFAGTSSSGVFRAMQPLTTSLEPVLTQIPDEFQLEQNYPNPFNPSTNISYRIFENSSVLLTVYDMLGKKVATLVNEIQQPGEYNIRFNAAEYLSGGFYFYTMQTNRRSETRRMVLVK